MEEVIRSWREDPDLAERIVHVETIPARRPVYEALDPPLPESLTAALEAGGVERLYRHQAEAIRRVRDGINTVIVAGTASGKSLCYQVPIAETAIQDPRTTALLVFPTKALTQDQFRSLHRLNVAEIVAAIYDGDTATDARAWARRNANVVLTNPDMLHVGILPNHRRWADFLGRLRYVVIDELHVLRGIFGSNVANLLRRLRRVTAHYGAQPTFVFSSATIGNPAELAERLIGLPVETVEDDVSPAGERRFVLWNPPRDDEKNSRRSAISEATDLFTDLVRRHLHTIVFTRSRKATELIYRWARERLGPDGGERIAPYRGGYLAKDRRRIEQALFSGELMGVTATNALELGIDVGGLDAAVITTFPGTIASLRQQAGRAGRTRDQSLAVLVGGEDALDQYFMTHPDQLFARPSEAAVVNPDNPHILAGHLSCAAYELPLIPEDRRYLGEETEEVATRLAAAGDLRLRDAKLYWAKRRSPAPAVNIRSSGGPVYSIIEAPTGELLGSMEESQAFSQAHPGAVYLHQGVSYLVEELDLEHHEIRVSEKETGYYTQPKEDKWLEIKRIDDTEQVGRLGHGVGSVEVETHVVAYQRREIKGGSSLGFEDLDLPPLRFVTQALWFTFPDHLYDEAEIGRKRVPGTLHAIEHTAIAMLPLFAICDRWDVGGLSTAMHPQTAGGVFFIYDGHPGGAGIAPIGYRAGKRHLDATLEVIEDCPCDAGCPSCVQSPKCGNFNEPLDKAGARALLGVALG